MRFKFCHSTVLAVAAIGVGALAQPVAFAAEEPTEVTAVRATAEKYKDVNVALAEGYIRDPADHCVSAAAEGLPAEWGAMGIHYIHPGLLKITTVRKPAVKARKGINPFTKEEVMFKAKPATTVVKVRALKKLKDMVL